MVLETILTFFDLSFDMIINKLVCVFFLKKKQLFLIPRVQNAEKDVKFYSKGT